MTLLLLLAGAGPVVAEQPPTPVQDGGPAITSLQVLRVAELRAEEDDTIIAALTAAIFS